MGQWSSGENWEKGSLLCTAHKLFHWRVLLAKENAGWIQAQFTSCPVSAAALSKVRRNVSFSVASVTCQTPRSLGFRCHVSYQCLNDD